MITVLIIIGLIVFISIILKAIRPKEVNTYPANTTSSTDGKIAIQVSGPDPENANDYRCYKFVERTSNLILEGWYKALLAQGRTFKPNFEEAIKQKLQTGKFENPLNFEDFFGSKFDYIAIDFETANNERISACALGYAFIKDNRLADEDYDYIRPPDHVTFNPRNVAMHGIDQETVAYFSNFQELWNNKLKELFNDNLLLLHNSSMDASVLKQLFLFYNITDHNIKYVDTMQIAKKLGYPGKLKELCTLFKIDFDNNHDPSSDAVACAQVAGEFEDKGIVLTDYIKKI